jgi:hypothetical protein
MQYLTHSVKERCMTPRFKKDDYSSDTDKSANLTVENGTVQVKSEKFSIEYSATEKGFSITVTGDGEYILPIITGKERKISLSDSSFISDNLSVTSSAAPTSDGKLYFNQVGGFIYSELRFKVQGKTDLIISVN